MKIFFALMLAMGALAVSTTQAQEDAAPCDFHELDAVYNKKLGEYLDYLRSIEIWRSSDQMLQTKSDASAQAFGNREHCRQSINAGPFSQGQKIKLLSLQATQ